MKDKTYYYSMDFFKFFCAIGVVTVHATSPIPGNDLDTFWNYHLYREFLNIASPFFFVAAGFLLFQKYKREENIAVLFGYIKRILSYYIVFSCFYIVVKYVFAMVDGLSEQQSLVSQSTAFIAGLQYQNMLNGTIGSGHLWFVASLLYACSLLALTVKMNINHRHVLGAAICVYLFVRSGVVEIPHFFVHGGITQGILYVSIGYFISQETENITRLKYPLVYFVLFGGLYYLSKTIDQPINITGILLPLYTFYLAVICIKYPHIGKGSFIARLARRHSLSIYILHMFVLLVLLKFYAYIGFDHYYSWAPHYVLAVLLCVVVSILLFNPIYNVLQRFIALVVYTVDERGAENRGNPGNSTISSPPGK
jgi:hypothetical protein